MTEPLMEGAPLIAPSSTDNPLYEPIVEACKTVYDPEIPVNIYDLGLIYTIDINDASEVRVVMTLTAPGCPVAGEMPGWVADAVEAVPGVKQVDVEMTFQPQWGMDMMSDEARLAFPDHGRPQKVDESGEVVIGDPFPLFHLFRGGDRHSSQRGGCFLGATPRPTQASSARASTSFHTSSLWESLQIPAISGNE